MKLMEFFNQASGTDKNDPLMSIVAKLNDEKLRRIELRRQSQGYLMPITKNGKTSFQADPEYIDIVEDIAAEIVECDAKIAELEERIVAVDEICAKYRIQRPLLMEMRREIGYMRNSITKAKEKAAGVLGHVLSFEIADIVLAQQHPKYLKAVREHEARLAKEPEIARLEAAVAELSGAIR
jgi:hypothetical protein